MERTSNRCSAFVEPNDFLKLKHGSEFKNIHFGSLGDLTCTDSKRSGSLIHREDSILSKGSLSSIFKKSFDSSWSSGPTGTYIPKPEKTFSFIETILETLSDMYRKYSKMTCADECGIEHQDYNEICLKLDDRMFLIQNLRSYYMSLTENRQTEFDKIESKIRSILSSKSSRKSFDIEDNEAYLQICRELLVVESKLERCSGKLQFQIMELDFIGKISPLDQYELSIRLNETTKFKTRIKIERNGYQVWDSRNFSINPMIDDYMYIKFSELKPLNKSIVLTEKKLPFINNLIKAEPNIFTLWLSPVGTIKLKVIVQWNATLEDPGLNSCLTGIEAKLAENSIKNDSIVHIRSATTSHKYTNAHLSSNFETLFRSHRVMDNCRSNSMSNIIEDVEAEKSGRKAPLEILHGSIINETINEVINVTPELEEPHVQALPNIKIDIVDENERIIPEARVNRKILLKTERVFVDVIDDYESCLDQEIDINCSKDQEDAEKVVSPEETQPAHIQGIASNCETIDSPIIGIDEASTALKEENEENSVKILETQTHGNYLEKSISQEDPNILEGEAICKMEVNLLVEDIEEEEDRALNSEMNDHLPSETSGGIIQNIGENLINEITGAEEKELENVDAAIDVGANLCGSTIDDKENNGTPHVDLDSNEELMNSDDVIDSGKPILIDSAIDQSEESDPKIDLNGNVEPKSLGVVIDNAQSIPIGAPIDQSEDTYHKAELNSDIEHRKSSVTIDDEEAGTDSKVIHNMEPHNSYINLGNSESTDCNDLAKDIPIADQDDSLNRLID